MKQPLHLIFSGEKDICLKSIPGMYNIYIYIYVCVCVFVFVYVEKGGKR